MSVEFPPTLEQVRSFVKTLHPSLQKIYHEASYHTNVYEDTLEADWQIASEIEEVFVAWAKKKHAES